MIHKVFQTQFIIKHKIHSLSCVWIHMPKLCLDAIISIEALNIFPDASMVIPEGDPGALDPESST